MSILSIVSALFAGWLFAEITGYFTHILLHSEKVPALSRAHMIHHLKIYSPKQGMRFPGKYKGSVDERASLFGIGLEWIVPLGSVVVLTVIAAVVLKVPVVLYLVFLGSAITWAFLMFSTMHDAMHLQGFFMERIPVVKTWFLQIRKLHDIHHLEIGDDGRMRKNYGICLFFMDRFGGTLSRKHKPFNEKGYQAALIRYGNLINS